VEDAGTAVEQTDSPDAEQAPEVASARLIVSLWPSDPVRSPPLAAGGPQIVDDSDRLGGVEVVAFCAEPMKRLGARSSPSTALHVAAAPPEGNEGVIETNYVESLGLRTNLNGQR